MVVIVVIQYVDKAMPEHALIMIKRMIKVQKSFTKRDSSTQTVYLRPNRTTLIVLIMTIILSVSALWTSASMLLLLTLLLFVVVSLAVMMVVVVMMVATASPTVGLILVRTIYQNVSVCAVF